jgi:predicted transcriptional regulator
MTLDEDETRKIGNWNEDVSKVMKSPQTQKILRMLYETDKSMGRLSLFLYEVALVSSGVSDIEENIVKVWNRFNTSSKVQQCLDLPVFDLMLILAIRNVHSNPFQFETLWQQIHKLAAQFKLERSDLKNALQNLEAAELIIPVKTRGGGKLKKPDETGFYRSNMSYNDMTEALKAYPQVPSSYQEYMN